MTSSKTSPLLILLKNKKEECLNYFCEICDADFNSHDELEEHLISHRIIENLEVPLNFNRNPIEIAAQNIKKVCCELCNKEFQRKSSLNRHLRNIHGINTLPKLPKNQEYPCDDCGKIYKDVSCFNRHKSMVHDGQKMKCEFCDKDFLNPKCLKTLVLKVYLLLQFMEFCCVKTFNTANLFSEIKNERYQAKFCFKKYLTKNLLYMILYPFRFFTSNSKSIKLF